MITTLKACALRRGYVTEHGLCVSTAKFAPFVMCQFYKDGNTASKMLKFSDTVLVDVE